MAEPVYTAMLHKGCGEARLAGKPWRWRAPRIPGRRTHSIANRQNIIVPIFDTAGVETVLTELPGNKKAAGAAQWV